MVRPYVIDISTLLLIALHCTIREVIACGSRATKTKKYILSQQEINGNKKPERSSPPIQAAQHTVF
jgi:hypothetical protein